MKTYFYVIEWQNGGKTSGLVLNAADSEEAYEEVYARILKPQSSALYGPCKKAPAGLITVFNKVDD